MSVRLLIAVASMLLVNRLALAADPVTITHLVTEIDVDADFHAVQTVHYEFRADNAAAAQGIAQQPILYSEQLETLEIVEAATLKADGRRIPVDPTTVQTQLQAAASGVPAFNDLKRKVVIFPDVGAGDSISLTWRKRVEHPAFPGAFFAVSTFFRTVPFSDARLTITTPAGMPLLIEAHDVNVQHEERDGRNVYTWSYSGGAVGGDPAVLLPQDRVPRVFASSLPDWDSLGHRWAAMVADKAVVTPRIQALADQLTSGVTDRREQARRIYDWVGTHIRWVAI